MSAVRLIAACAIAALTVGAALGATALVPLPLVPGATAAKSVKTAKYVRHKAARHVPAGKSVHPAAVPLPKPAPVAILPAAPALRTGAPPIRTTAPLAVAGGSAASTLDLAAMKTAIELVHRNHQEEATNIEKTISDPLARKFVEWIILRDDDTGSIAPQRYAAFIAANPTWPSIVTLRRRAEAVLWQQDSDPQTTLDFLSANPPLSAKGFFALARAWLAKDQGGRAQAAVRTAWRTTAFSEQVEEQARQLFAGLITPADDLTRMDARFYAEDSEAGLRAARHLDAGQIAIARAWAAVIDRSGNAKALLDAVPEAARHDPGYMFSRIHWLRRGDKIKDAAQLMLAAPRDPNLVIDPDQWWVERRLISRKLLDLGDAKTAYEIAAGAAAPASENYRAEQQFTAGWIALRFLRQPALALPHFARIVDGVVNPITLARSYYWQARAAEALGRKQEAHSLYEAAGRFPTAYYGQLARAQLHLNDLALEAPAQPPAAHRPLELGQVFEMLYSIDERDIVAAMAADIADKTGDAGGLASLAEITARHNDARATLLIGKTALSRGMPFARYAFPDFGVPDYHQIGPQVERCVVFSIVRQESTFNPRVVSRAHAYGLMQVTPSAGRNTARKFKVAFDQRRLMSDVAYNVQLGAAELGDDIAAFRGSYILAFAAYNAGQHRVNEWIAQYGDPRDRNVDPIDWIERIPFSETRNYVERVVENMQVYRARLDNNSKLLIEADLRRGS